MLIRLLICISNQKIETYKDEQKFHLNFLQYTKHLTLAPHKISLPSLAICAIWILDIRNKEKSIIAHSLCRQKIHYQTITKLDSHNTLAVRRALVHCLPFHELLREVFDSDVSSFPELLIESPPLKKHKQGSHWRANAPFLDPKNSIPLNSKGVLKVGTWQRRESFCSCEGHSTKNSI